MSGAVQYSFGPLSTGIEADAFLRWFEDGANPSIEFARGQVPPRSLAVWQISVEWAQSGLITVTSQKQDGGGYVWIASRLFGAAAAMIARPAPVVSAAPEKLTELGDTTGQAMLKMIRRAANFGMPCPTLNDLAKAAELTGPDQARYQLGKLESAGKIRIQNNPDGQRRIQILGHDGGVIKSTRWLDFRYAKKEPAR